MKKYFFYIAILAFFGNEIKDFGRSHVADRAAQIERAVNG